MKNIVKSFMGKKAVIQLLVGAVAFFMSTELRSQTLVTLSPSADVEVWADNPTLNYGSAPSMATSPATWQGVDHIKRGLIKFDLSSIPSGAIVSDVKLRLYHITTAAFARTLAVHKASTSWTESGATWANFGNSFDATSSATDNFSWPSDLNGVWDLTNDVQDMVNGTISNNGWVIKDNSEATYQNFYWNFATKENVTTAIRPVLEVTYTVAANLSVSASVPTICDGASSILTATGGTNYTWSPSTGLNSTTGAVVTATPNTTTTYTVTADVGGSSTSETLTVTVNSLPTVSLSAVKATSGCNGEIATTVTGNSLSYSWSGPSSFTSTNKDLTNLCAGIYNLDVTDANGCTVLDTIDVNDCN